MVYLKVVQWSHNGASDIDKIILASLCFHQIFMQKVKERNSDEENQYSYILEVQSSRREPQKPKE